MSNGREQLRLKHLRAGWVLVFVYILLGLLLDGLHAFKLGLYLDVSNETRRLVWTLAHAHGTLIGLLNLGFAVSLSEFILSEAQLRIASWCMLASGILMPLGFFLGGIWIYGGDPGPLVFLVPIGGVMLTLSAGLSAVGVWKARTE